MSLCAKGTPCIGPRTLPEAKSSSAFRRLRGRRPDHNAPLRGVSRRNARCGRAPHLSPRAMKSPSSRSSPTSARDSAAISSPLISASPYGDLLEHASIRCRLGFEWQRHCALRAPAHPGVAQLSECHPPDLRVGRDALGNGRPPKMRNIVDQVPPIAVNCYQVVAFSMSSILFDIGLGRAMKKPCP